MAAKSLSKAAADMDVEIYVEKQGAAGVEDELTSEQIKEADVVIFAIEKGIDESRFAGKKIYKTKPGKAIKEGKKTIEEAKKAEGKMPEDGLLTAKNKWLIAHEDAKIAGAFNGLKGENITID